MYFGPDGVSIEHLLAFTTGFRCGQQSPDSEDILDCFTNWVADYYGPGRGGPNWAIRLLQQTHGDQRAVFDLFLLISTHILQTALGWGRLPFKHGPSETFAPNKVR